MLVRPRPLDPTAATKDDVAAIRADLGSLGKELKGSLGSLEKNLRGELAALDCKLQGSIAESKADILKWMIGTIGVQSVAIIGAVATLIRLFQH